jgi:hypothetical protein
MNVIARHPLLIFALTFLVLWLFNLLGDWLRRWLRPLQEEERSDFSVIVAGCLTLLGLIIGFTFSMALGRYDQRKTYEAEEANAIGTEYVRADLLPSAEAAKVHDLLRSYLDQRVRFYTTRDLQQIQQIDAYTAQLQNDLWTTVKVCAGAQPTPVVALVVSGMNDVLNSQGYAQAAWRNRIPYGAWVLLVIIAIGCNFLVGYGSHRTERDLFLILPLAISISFFLIADIDSPRRGLIHVQAQNLASLSETLKH